MNEMTKFMQMYAHGEHRFRFASWLVMPAEHRHKSWKNDPCVKVD
jgi:hypothetical protein